MHGDKQAIYAANVLFTADVREGLQVSLATIALGGGTTDELHLNAFRQCMAKQKLRAASALLVHSVLCVVRCVFHLLGTRLSVFLPCV